MNNSTPRYRYMIKESVFILVTRFLGILLQIYWFYQLTNNVAPLHVGLFSIVIACNGLVKLFGPLGLDQVAIRFYPLYQEIGQEGKANGLEKISTLVVMAVMALSLIHISEPTRQ